MPAQFVNVPSRKNSLVVNSTITTGGTAQTILAAKPNRVVFHIQNTSDTAMWVNFGAVAATNVGITVAAGGSYTTPAQFCPTGLISVIGATTGKTFAYFSY